MEKLRTEVLNALRERPKQGSVPPLWDGHASERNANILVNRL